MAIFGCVIHCTKQIITKCKLFDRINRNQFWMWQFKCVYTKYVQSHNESFYWIKCCLSFRHFHIVIQTANHEFSLMLRKDRKCDTIKLSSEFRNEILTSLFKYHKEFAEKIKTEVSVTSVFDLWILYWLGCFYFFFLVHRNILPTNIIGQVLGYQLNWK